LIKPLEAFEAKIFACWLYQRRRRRVSVAQNCTLFISLSKLIVFYMHGKFRERERERERNCVYLQWNL